MSGCGGAAPATNPSTPTSPSDRCGSRHAACVASTAVSAGSRFGVECGASRASRLESSPRNGSSLRSSPPGTRRPSPLSPAAATASTRAACSGGSPTEPTTCAQCHNASAPRTRQMRRQGDDRLCSFADRARLRADRLRDLPVLRNAPRSTAGPAAGVHERTGWSVGPAGPAIGCGDDRGIGASTRRCKGVVVIVSGLDVVHLGMLRRLLDEGVIERRVAQHSWPGCDGMLTCDCPTPSYSYRVAPTFRDALEGERGASSELGR